MNSAELQILLDGRGQIFYHYTEMIYRAAIIPKFKRLDISFELNVQAMVGRFTKIPMLSIEDKTSELTFYVTEFGEFEVMHHHSEFDAFGEKVLLLKCDLSYMPHSTDHYYHIIILDKTEVMVDIDGRHFSGNIDREIGPKDEPMDLWINRVGYNINIRDLLIGAL